jgi:hypothetical protein
MVTLQRYSTLLIDRVLTGANVAAMNDIPHNTSSYIQLILERQYSFLFPVTESNDDSYECSKSTGSGLDQFLEVTWLHCPLNSISTHGFGADCWLFL